MKESRGAGRIFRKAIFLAVGFCLSVFSAFGVSVLGCDGSAYAAPVFAGGVSGQVASIFSSPVFAAPKEDELPAYRIQLSPSKFNLELKAGQTFTETFQVQNTGRESFDFEVSIAPYSVIDEQYTADYTSEAKYTDIAKWATFSEAKGKVGPNESKDIKMTIKVPKDVPAGGQYAVVLAQIANQSAEGAASGLGITQQVGIMLYSNVDGVTRRGGKVLENKIAGFLFEPPIAATSLIENSGNTHVYAQYVLQVYPLIGDEEVYTNEESPEQRVILPETRRFNTISWEGSPKLGIFRVKQTVKIYEETSIQEKVVVLCPIWFLFILILLVFCVVFWIISRARNRKKEEA